MDTHNACSIVMPYEEQLGVDGHLCAACAVLAS